jgi:hypothetical protein
MVNCCETKDLMEMMLSFVGAPRRESRTEMSEATVRCGEAKPTPTGCEKKETQVSNRTSSRLRYSTDPESLIEMLKRDIGGQGNLSWPLRTDGHVDGNGRRRDGSLERRGEPDGGLDCGRTAVSQMLGRTLGKKQGAAHTPVPSTAVVAALIRSSVGRYNE